MDEFRDADAFQIDVGLDVAAFSWISSLSASVNVFGAVFDA